MDRTDLPGGSGFSGLFFLDRHHPSKIGLNRFNVSGHDVSQVGVDPQLCRKQPFHQFLKGREAGCHDLHDIVHAASRSDSVGDLIQLTDISLKTIEIRLAMALQRNCHNGFNYIRDLT